MIKEIIGVTMATALAGGAFAGGMVLSNNMKDDNYAIVLTEKEDDMNALSSSLSSLNDEIASRDLQIQNLMISKNALQKQYEELLLSDSENKDELARLVNEVSRLNKQLENEKSKVLSLQDQYLHVKEEYDNVNEQYQELLQESEVNKQQIQSLNDNISSLHKRIQELEDVIDSFNNEGFIYFDEMFDGVIGGYSGGIKISESRALFASQSRLFSYNNLTGKFNLLSSNIFVSLNRGFGDESYRILPNGNVVLWGTGTNCSELILYKYSEDSIERLPLKSRFLLLSLDQYSFISKSGDFIISGFEESLLVSSDGSRILQYIDGFRYLSFTYMDNNEDSGVAILQFVSSDGNSVVFYKYDSDNHILIKVSDCIPISGAAGGYFKFFKLKNFSYIFNIRFSIYFYDSSNSLSYKLGDFNNDFDYFNNTSQFKIFECSNGDILMFTSRSNKVYLLDINNKTFSSFGKKIFDFSSLSFSEDDSGVVIKDNSGDVLIYIFSNRSLVEVFG